jgi:hypothetical protein
MEGLPNKYRDKIKVVNPTSYEEAVNQVMHMESEDHGGCLQEAIKNPLQLLCSKNLDVAKLMKEITIKKMRRKKRHPVQKL